MSTYRILFSQFSFSLIPIAELRIELVELPTEELRIDLAYTSVKSFTFPNTFHVETHLSLVLEKNQNNKNSDIICRFYSKRNPQIID